MSDDFHSTNKKEADKRVIEALTHRGHNEFKYLFFGMACFQCTFSLQVKEGSHPY